MKTLARRDSCTAILRKMGIHQRDYDAFIEVVNGKFICHVTRAEKHLESLKNLAKPNQVVNTDRTVSSVAREMVKAGKSNAEIWEVLKSEFKLDNSKRSYPSWYRSQCKRAEREALENSNE